MNPQEAVVCNRGLKELHLRLNVLADELDRSVKHPKSYREGSTSAPGRQTSSSGSV